MREMLPVADAVNKLLTEHVDIDGRVTVFPSKNSDPHNGKWDSLNQHLWTGATCLILQKLGHHGAAQELAETYVSNLYRFTTMGTSILTRHHYKVYPQLPFDFKEAQAQGYSHGYDPISLDEYLGCFFVETVRRQERLLTSNAVDAIYYGAQSKDWRVYDREPNHEFSYLQLIPELLKMIYIAIKTRDFGGSNELDVYIYQTKALKYFTRTLQPKDVYVMKLTMGKKPNWLEKLHFNISINHSIKKNKPSGCMLAGYKALFLELQGLPYKPEFLMAMKKHAYDYFDYKGFPLIDLIHHIKVNQELA